MTRETIEHRDLPMISSITELARRIVAAKFLPAALAAAGTLSAAQAQSAGHGVAAANLHVVQHDEGNDDTSVTVTTTLSINEFALRPGSNRGDYNVQIGLGSSDDQETGILLS